MIDLFTYVDYTQFWSMGIVCGIGLGSMLYITGYAISVIYRSMKEF